MAFSYSFESMAKLTKQYLAQIMPETTETVAMFRSVFGSSVKVLWAKENGVEVGKVPESKGVSPDCYLEPYSKAKKRL